MERYTSCVLLLAWFIRCSIAEYIEPGPKYSCKSIQEQYIHPCKCLRGSDEGIYVHCENTNLASLAIAFNNLAVTEIIIEELTIDKSHFGTIYGSIFFKTKIRKLTISNTPLVDIDKHVFQGINETLQEFHILNSMLSTFPKLAFKNLGKLLILKIDHHKINTLDKDIFADSLISQKLEKLYLSNGKLNDLPVESFQVLRKLKTLDLHGNEFENLKRNQFKNLRDLEVLDISHNNITKLDSSHIADLTKLSWCNVSHNALNEITRGTFARNSVLRVLNLSHNRIKRLDVNSFRGMRFLRRLYLSDNNITDIGRGTFSSITRIGTIDLARNQIKKIDYQMFAQLNYVEIIDVAENMITEVQKQSFKDLYLTNINMTRNKISKFENRAFENCVNMSMLDLSYNEIKEMPKFTFDELTYATELNLAYNALTNFSQIPLHNMTGIKVINVSHNQIVDIPKNTFPKLYELHTIDISYNNLTTISNAVFQTLFSLRNLNMSYNALESIKAPTFGTLPTLLNMDLSNNKLNEIARGALTKLSSLRFLSVENNQLDRIFQIPISLNYLIFRYNRLSEIAVRTWPTMNAMLELDLTGNQLGDSLAEGSFSGLLTLRTLYLNKNGISKIPRESLSVLSTLQYLHLEDNNITVLARGAFGKLPVVFELNLHNNHISNISTRAFDGLLQLLTLNMSMNEIKLVPNGAFIGLVSLRQLDLSHNQIRKLDNKTNGVLDDCLSLEKINLSHNKFSFITKKTFPSDPYIPYRLREIDLSYNEMPVLTYDLSFGTKKVTNLNVSHNYINEIRRHVLSNLTLLETLDLSYNELKDLAAENEKYELILPKNLTFLSIRNNRLQKFPNDMVFNMTTLKTIDLQSNSIERFDMNLLNRVRNGMDLLIAGNPLQCDCNVRPLTHYLNTQLDVPTIYKDIECDSPALLKGKQVYNVSDDQLNCIDSQPENFNQNMLGQLADLSFRDIFYYKDNLTIQWAITAPNKDIAGFYVIIRNRKNSILLERHLSYNSRVIQLTGSEICDGNCDLLEMCVMAKNSFGTIPHWFDSQCIYLPNDFDRIKRKYNSRYNQMYIIHSLKKNIKAQMVSNSNSNSNSYHTNSESNANSIEMGPKTNVYRIFILIYSVVCISSFS